MSIYRYKSCKDIKIKKNMKVLSFPGYETWGVRGREDQEILKHIDLKSDLLEQTVGEANN